MVDFALIRGGGTGKRFTISDCRTPTFNNWLTSRFLVVSG